MTKKDFKKFADAIIRMRVDNLADVQGLVEDTIVTVLRAYDNFDEEKFYAYIDKRLK